MNFKIFLFSLTLLFTQFAHSKTDLNLNLKLGETYHQTMSTESIINQLESKNNQDLILTMNGSIAYKVNSIKQGNYYLDVVYDSLGMNMTIPGYTMNYSSEKTNSEDDYISILLSELKDKNFKIVMTTKGKILEVTNLDNSFESAIEKLKDLDEKTRNKLESDLKNAFGKESFKNSFETITAIYPPEPVEIGRQWKAEVILNHNMPIKINNIYKFEAETDDFYLITGIGSLISTKPIDNSLKNSTPFAYELTGVTSSKIKIDKKTGWIKEAIIRQNMEGFSILKSELSKENPKKVGMEFKITTTFRD